MEPKFPKEIFWVTGTKNRLYRSRGHVKQALNYNKSDRVFKLDFYVGSWVEVTEEFNGRPDRGSEDLPKVRKPGLPDSL